MEYKRPILSSVFSIFGVLYGAILIGAGIIASRDIASRNSENIGLPIFLALCLALTGFMVIIVFLGIAQIFDFIGKIAFYTEHPKTKANSTEQGNFLLLVEKLEENREQQEKTNKLLSDFLGKIQ